jgi:predicted dehydrogenase
MLPRRTFLKNAGLLAAGVAALRPLARASARTVSPNEKLNVAVIGFGGVGGSNISNCSDENIVAMCDLDLKRCAGTIKKFPKAELFTDFRKMLEKRKDIDGVIIATPDHSHAFIGMACMREGKHVYIQKPIAHSVFEARRLTEGAREFKVVSQMGNQGHSGEGIRQICEWIDAGIIGEVREAHAWTNRPIWPQNSDMERPKGEATPPEGMDWDLWCGPAPLRPFNAAYHPGKWRAWCDFGTGALGDMGCHIIDPVFQALKLLYPTSVEGNVSTTFEEFGKKSVPKHECFPRSTIARFRFPARGALPPVELTWWDGGLMPSRPVELEDDMPFGDSDGGCLFVGTKGKIVCGCYGSKPRLLDADQRNFVKTLAKTIPRIPGNTSGHEKDWIRACKGGVAACSNFDYSGPLSEMVLMGNLAIRFPDRKLLWDGEKMQVTNDKAANAFVHRQYRDGYTL